jgi:hypothetical protein
LSLISLKAFLNSSSAENAGCFNGFGAKAEDDDSDRGSGYSAEVLDSMTLEEKAAAWQAMLEEDRRKRGKI